MRALLMLVLLGVGGLVAYNYHNGRDLFHLPGASVGTIENRVRETVSGAVRDTARSVARETSAEVKDHAAAGVHAAVNRTEDAVAATAITSKIKAKMALDDLVKAADVSVETDAGVVTLTGAVGSAEERRRAVRIATETAGVTKVVNHLRVR